MDTAYLKKQVGDALMRGCSACAIEAPVDPVEYLGQWLHRYVEASKIEEQLARERRSRTAKLEDEKIAVDTAKATADDIATRKAEALVKLQGMTEDPFVLWSEAAKTVKEFTGINGCYIAALREDEEEDPEVAEESDDEEEGEPEAEEEAAAPEEGAEEEEEVPEPIDYTNKYLEYEAASDGHEWMIDTTLKRPNLVDEESGEKLPDPPGSGVTFRVIDEDVPTIEIANVLDDAQVKFYRTIPSPGTFFAAQIKSAHNGEIEAVLCVDTLMPSGSGLPLAEAERDFVVAVTRAVTKAMDGAETLRLKAVKLSKEADDATAMAAELAEMAEDEAEEAEEAASAVDVAEKALATEKSKLELIHEKVRGMGDKNLKLLRAMPKTPKQTYRVIKALLYILGYERAQFGTWKACRELLTTKDFLQKLSAFDAEKDRDVVAWRGARSCLRGVDKKRLESESPFGMALMKIQEVIKTVAKLAKAYRDAVEQARIEAEEAAKAAEEAEAAAREAEEAERAALEAEGAVPAEGEEAPAA
eukprot:CAMPEP_0182887664 /NCGR_PEP_ID=MMETSP0034_2-20130328/20964_1 /TAXON_ID=156128 /ORGANISM="Nephroselmis pyriformis, Strain CCMP717" /LENGTH=529 /DNA_ID=CAMNT_0025021041 /DNA_START=19 /DNA_END=1604 /DNA_ORIENTATION=+